MEILLELDSPPELAEERMKKQVERLANSMSQGNSQDGLKQVKKLVRQYCSTSTVPVARADRFGARFVIVASRVIEAMKTA